MLQIEQKFCLQLIINRTQQRSDILSRRTGAAGVCLATVLVAQRFGGAKICTIRSQSPGVIQMYTTLLERQVSRRRDSQVPKKASV